MRLFLPIILRCLFVFSFLIFNQNLWTQILTSKIPIVVITTPNNQTIVDETKIKAHMKIINHQDVNKDTDVGNEYDGTIGIEYRGSSSQSFPKKAYSIETRNESSEDLDVSIFGWPKESDWILYASYNEKSLMHNAFAMILSNRMGMYASRTKYVEVIVNGVYMGVYVFMEKVKVAKGRVDIANLKDIDISGDEMTGGYIVKIDKTTGENEGGWVSSTLTSTFPNRQIYYQYDSPKEMQQVQKNYIRQYVENFESALKGDQFTDENVGYKAYINPQNFIRYFLVNEVARNIDGLRLSTFLYKDKDSKGGKLTLGPPWDFDIAFGNADYCEGNRYDLWCYKFNQICPDDGYHVPFWWQRLLQDSSFVTSLRTEYFDMRKNGVLRLSYLNGIVDSLQNELQEPQKRNFTKWPIIGQYVWPSPWPIASTWNGEVNELKQWLANRLAWLDVNMPEVVKPTPPPYTGKQMLKIYPNPAPMTPKVAIYLRQKSLVTWQLYDESGRLLHEEKQFCEEGKNELSWEWSSFEWVMKSAQNYYIKASFGQEQFIEKIVKL